MTFNRFISIRKLMPSGSFSTFVFFPSPLELVSLRSHTFVTGKGDRKARQWQLLQSSHFSRIVNYCKCISRRAGFCLGFYRMYDARFLRFHVQFRCGIYCLKVEEWRLAGVPWALPSLLGFWSSSCGENVQFYFDCALYVGHRLQWPSFHWGSTVYSSQNKRHLRK